LSARAAGIWLLAGAALALAASPLAAAPEDRGAAGDAPVWAPWQAPAHPMDRDGDGRVTRSEYIDGVADRVRATLIQHFAALDRNTDGKLGRAEFIQGQLDLIRAELGQRFDRADRDGDGAIRARADVVGQIVPAVP
jgi:hypothetical protein